ncbi:Nucleosome remodeling factor, subunit NURF301/BPTF [Handroanthus impetiginosus]|uniref:Nucleosome remodeling factor, subunit NURF301/BPTF n=1 Tax=Handroanthus impetiginosus TaxID=429701 RepID=A0A2G9G6Q6_9LAMI|nr:Nucleosome remodeling factor, subunit NURF301/BPTF [Handroanthus impetiginosus]
MEPSVVEPPRRRGRKRKNIDVQDCNGLKKVVGTRSLKLVGRYVRKEFHGSGLFLGKISFYDSGLYRINYEDGDCEDLDSSEVKVFLVEDSDLIGEWSERKEKLDKLVVGKDVNAEVLKVENAIEPANVNPVDSSVLNDLSNSEAAANEMVDVNDDSNVDADSSSDSCDNSRECDASLDMEEPLVPPPELPPSSGHIGIPEEYVSHLFSVHSFLRSFSVPLFLYPFGLDDFVGGLNCSTANTLLDSVHVALLRALKRHIERLSSDGSELALKCVRCLDWSLLDTLTWPIFLVHYLMVMGYTNGPDWKGFYSHALERDYCTLPAGRKLLILQILCDNVLDSEEIRAEMDMRVESEVGIDIDASPMVTPTGGSRRVHPRYSIASASQDREALQSVAAGGPVGSSIDEDGNGDECRICGMDGLLICCDGCPSSYHSRCLGLNKMHMPEGSWYCPECKINASEPTILQGTTLRGGHNFGVDPYGQVFVATCDHLLVLKASLNSETCLRYYNRHDIPRVLHSLYSKAERVVTYSEICRGVMQYWELPEDTLPCNVIPEVGLQLSNEKEGECTIDLDNLLDKSVPEMAEVENMGSCVTGTCAADMAASSPTNCTQKPVLSGNSLDTVSKSDQLGGYTYPTRQQSRVIMQNILVKPTSSSGLIGQPADANQLSQQSASNVTETVSYTTRNINGNYSGTVNGVLVEAKMSLPCLELSNKVDRKSYVNLCMGSSFKPTGYINHYLHGDFAASAAANLAILSSEGNQVPESRSSYNHRKVMSDNVALQVKAFSSASMRFFWPNTEKKLVEVPRERCTWCFSCKAPVASRRGCLLNAAASNAMRGATKVLAGVRPMKNGDGGLLGIAAYIMFMEESLNGLLIGPFLNDTFRRRWRKQVEQATTRNAVKILLLELEENVRTIAYSGDWIKLVDGCSTQSSTSQIAANVAESTQKRRPGRRGRKPSAVAEVASTDYQDKLADFTWWRGGALSKLMFQRGVLPCSMIRKAARQGGLKRITGIHYVEGQETLKISKRLIWRAAVEMSRNLAQLALQVRYFDFHVRWADMVRPEQTPPDGKGDTETSAFRNAFICDKKNLEHEVRYCVAFGSQKHLPSRVMKNIAEVEQLGDGKGRYWFSETRIPLYLIKEFEEKVGKSKSVDVPSKLQKIQQKPSHKNIFSYLLRKQENMLKSSCCSCHQDVLQRNAVKCSACQGFCHKQCLTSSTVHMNEEVEFLITCKHCSEARAMTQVQSSYGSPTSPLHLQSRDFSNAGTTKTRGKSAGHKRTSAASAGTLEYSSERKPTTGSAVAKKSKNKHWGLIWRKKNCEDTGIDFRLKNILLKGNPDMDLSNPVCRLCNQPYNADLMYIRCETCLYWYHADAVELDESKIFCLVGFKCSKCRRIKSPVCPYLDPDKKKALEDKIESKAPKVNIHEMDRKNSSLISEQLKDGRPAYFALDTKSEVTLVAADDSLLLSLSEVEQHTDTSEVDYGWNNSNLSRSGPTKLPVRRHIRQENDLYCPNPSDPFQVDVSTAFETNVFNSAEKLPVRRHVKRENNSDCHFHAEASNPSETNAMSSMEDTLSPQPQWVVSKDNFDDNITLDYDSLGYDDMEFEPQTYFSFNELLASDDGGHANGNGSPGNVTENWESASMLPGNETLEISYDQEEPIITVGTTIEVVPCNICSHSEPCPDLSCQMCGMWIHSHCSPWLESSSHEDGWRCGNCREWR